MVKTENKINKEESNSKAMHASSSDNKKKKYKGVRMRSWGSWVSEIRAPNQKTRIWLGSYSTAEAAARAYDAALLCLKGSSANLNFPLASSSHFIPQDTSVMSPKSIQRVAAAAANSFVDENGNSNNINAICTPPIPASTSSSLVSSPSITDDDVSAVSLFSSFGGCDQLNESMAMMVDSWYGFDGLLESPKHVDQMLSGALYDIDSTQMLDDWYEDGGDISLWSYC